MNLSKAESLGDRVIACERTDGTAIMRLSYAMTDLLLAGAAEGLTKPDLRIAAGITMARIFGEYRAEGT